MLIQARSFNNITILDDFTIRKSSKDKNKLLAEYRWLKDSYRFNCPKVYDYIDNDDYASYDIEYIHGKTLAQLYINEELSINEFRNIFEFIKNIIFVNREIGVLQVDLYKSIEVERMYVTKTIERLHSYGYNFHKQFVLNESLLPDLNTIIKDCNVDVDKEDLCYMHGDLCFSNIILSEEYYKTKNLTTSLYFIDPRGIDFHKDITALGDYKYEIGKLAHSVIGKYDLIKANKIEAIEQNTYNFKYNYIVSDYKQEIDKLFFEIFGDNEIWYNIMVNLFLSMIPLHSDNPKHQVTIFANALRLYKEKTIKFN
jgi:hypothetical protein